MYWLNFQTLWNLVKNENRYSVFDSPIFSQFSNINPSVLLRYDAPLQVKLVGYELCTKRCFKAKSDEGRCPTRNVEVIDTTLFIWAVVKVDQPWVIRYENYVFSLDYSCWGFFEFVKQSSCLLAYIPPCELVIGVSYDFSLQERNFDFISDWLNYFLYKWINFFKEFNQECWSNILRLNFIWFLQILFHL